MAKRKIIRIDEEKCNGCGICVPACREGALQIIGGKARLVSDSYCDGLGACLGECPLGAISFEEREAEEFSGKSELRQWPVQLHLVPPTAPYFEGADVVLAADCTAFALGDFHKDHLKGKSLAIACPKLDEGQDIYVEKIAALIDKAKINTLTVMIMEVPCCGGLLSIAQEGKNKAARKIPIKLIVVGLQGGIVKEEWV
ncbi:4Fe-4S binding protein [Candidatus Saganbacteria bacterium]|nr:4Fe-4S binding protein [Candidatus Saganbacteria bacterium]